MKNKIVLECVFDWELPIPELIKKDVENYLNTVLGTDTLKVIVTEQYTKVYDDQL